MALARAYRVDQPAPQARWRRPILLWPMAWFLMGVGLLLGDVHSEPPQGPLWAALALGALGWGLAGGFSGPRGRDHWRPWLAVAWALLYPVSLIVGMRWAAFVETALGGAGFEGLVAALGAGGAVGGGLTCIARAGGVRKAGWPRALGAMAIFGVLFLVGSWGGTIVSYILADPVEALLGGLLGDPAALALGFGLGWAAGGVAAGMAAGMAARG